MQKLSTHDEVIPLFCPTCSYSLNTNDDINAFEDKKCCFYCFMFWIESKRHKEIDEVDKTSELFITYLNDRDQQFKARLGLILSSMDS